MTRKRGFSYNATSNISNLQDVHKDSPFCSENGLINKCSKTYDNVYDKENYVILYRAFKQYLQAGLQLKKVHKILKFSQSRWLKPYNIDLNLEFWKKPTNNFDEKSYKLMNNVFYEKSIENVRLRSNLKIVRKWDGRYGDEKSYQTRITNDL